MADRPVFICGAPRSGTSLLRRILACSETIAFPKYETWFFPNIYNRMKLIEKLEREDRFKVIVNSLSRMSHDFYKQFLENKVTFEKLRESDQKPETLFDILQEEVAIRQNRRRWGDKSPGHEYYAELILEAYPSAKLVYIFRDFRDVAASRKFKPTIKGDKVLSRDGIRGAMMWKKSIQQHIFNVNTLPHGQYYSIRYEELLRHPRETLEKLGDFVEDEIEDCLFRHDGEWRFRSLNESGADLAPGEQSASSYEERQFKSVIAPSAIGGYRNKLSKTEVKAIERLCRYEARLTGYIGSRSDIMGSIRWLKFSTGKSKQWEGQPHCRIDETEAM